MTKAEKCWRQCTQVIDNNHRQVNGRGILRRLDRFHNNSVVVIRFELYAPRKAGQGLIRPVNTVVDQRSSACHLPLAVGL